MAALPGRIDEGGGENEELEGEKLEGELVVDPRDDPVGGQTLYSADTLCEFRREAYYLKSFPLLEKLCTSKVGAISVSAHHGNWSQEVVCRALRRLLR